MDDTKLKEGIAKFEAANKNVAVLYGGDGTLVGEWRKFRTRKGSMTIKYNSTCKTRVNLEDDNLYNVALDMVCNATTTGKRAVEVDNAQMAVACELAIRQKHLDLEFENSHGEKVSEEVFYRIFYAPLRDLEIARVDMNIDNEDDKSPSKLNEFACVDDI